MATYKYIIVGGGPSGLILSLLLGKIGHKCLVIDSEVSLGGCHRVYRVNGLFTEHAPRIYSSTYINTSKILKLVGTTFEDTFTPYDFNIANIGGNVSSHLTSRELMLFFYIFIMFTLNNHYGKKQSIMQFMKEHNFTEDAIDYIDRLCRLSDGIDATKYSINKFLQIVNQQGLYTLYQPKMPTDVGLIYKIENACKDTGNVQFLVSTKVENLILNSDKTNISGVKTNDNQIYYADNVILAVPPKSLFNILNNTNIPSAFGNDLNTWAKASSYNNYIAITYHWDSILSLPKVWGFPKTEWGVAFIVLSNYIDFKDIRSKTVISTCITIFDKAYKGKTAHEIDNENDLKQHVFEQLKESFPDLKEPSISLLSPTVKRINGMWVENDSGYVKTFDNTYLPFQSSMIKNLYNLGTQNGFSDYKFTSFESAVSNAIHLAHQLDYKTKQIIKTSKAYTLTDIARLVYVLIGIIIALGLYKFIIKR